MPRKISVADHLTLDELEERYKKVSDAVESRRYHLIWLVKSGYPLKEAANIVRLTYDYAQKVVQGYNQEGEQSLRNKIKEHKGKGHPPLLSPEQQEELRERLKTPPDDGGLWNGPKVAQWMSQKIGRAVAPQRGWDYLKRLGYSCKSPRPHHVKGNPEAHQQFKEEVQARVDELQRENPEAEIEVWAFDEHRVGLHPIIRRIWSLVGERPVAAVHPRYEWTYVYGYVLPTTGETEWHLLPRVNRQWMECSLAEFAKARELGPKKIAVLVMDGAGWHRAQDLEIPEGVKLMILPAYSPELQPAERLWPLVDEPLVNRALDSIQQVEDILEERCRVLSELFQSAIQKLTQFHWWPIPSTPEAALG